MANKIARVILTFDCERSCSYCCNNYSSIIDKAIPITLEESAEALKDYRVVAITGGEPLLDPQGILDFAKMLRRSNPDRMIYLYTAKFDITPIWFLNIIDGIHFTLHESTTAKEVEDFEVIQRALQEYPGRSYRLFVHPGIEHFIPIRPRTWSRIESKPWINENDCKLPEDETLFKIVK